MQVEGAGDLLVAVAAQVDVAAAPELVPGQHVTLQQAGRTRRPAAPRPRAASPASAIAWSLEGVERNELLHGDRFALAHVDGEVLGNEAGLLHGPPFDGDSLASWTTRVLAAWAIRTVRSWSSPAAIPCRRQSHRPRSVPGGGRRAPCIAPRRRWSPCHPEPSGPPRIPTSSRGRPSSPGRPGAGQPWRQSDAGSPGRPPVRVADADQARQHPAGAGPAPAGSRAPPARPSPATGRPWGRNVNGSQLGALTQVLVLDLASGDPAVGRL